MSHVKFIDDPLFVCNFYYIISYILLFTMFIAGIFISEYLINKKHINNSVIVSLILISGLIFISSILLRCLCIKFYKNEKNKPLLRDNNNTVLY